MHTPLPEQLASVLAALEKATPQILELATRTMRLDALLTGTLEALILICCVVAAHWLWRWLPRDSALDNGAPDEVRALACFTILALMIAVLILACQLPEQASKCINARYWAIADLLARVKP